MSILTGQTDKLRKAALIQEEYVYDVKLLLTNANDTILSLCYRVRELRAENAKLRELVRDWRVLAVCGADSLSDWIEIQADLESRMRELGVEVTE